MFRRLFAIETQALQARDEHDASRQDNADMPHEMLRDMARYSATPSRFGMWASRANA